MRKFFLTTAVAFVVLALGSVARADTVHFAGGFGATATVTDYTLAGNTFSFTVTNTSSTGSITAIGFDLTGDRPNTFDLVSATNANFDLAHDVNVQAGAVTTEGTNQGVFDLALLTGDNFGSGQVAAGIGPGQSATFVITGDFSGMTAQQIAESLSLRFKGINPGDESTVGEPVPNPIPEPMTMILFGTGLAGVAARARRRKKGAAE